MSRLLPAALLLAACSVSSDGAPSAEPTPPSAEPASAIAKDGVAIVFSGEIQAELEPCG